MTSFLSLRFFFVSPAKASSRGAYLSDLDVILLHITPSGKGVMGFTEFIDHGCFIFRNTRGSRGKLQTHSHGNMLVDLFMIACNKNVNANINIGPKITISTTCNYIFQALHIKLY